VSVAPVQGPPTMRDWAVAILQGIGAPTSPNNIANLAAWNACEGNAQGQSGISINNPFNTTLGSQYPGVNSVGVRNFPSMQVGVQQTVATINQGNMSPIKQALVSDAPRGTFAAALGKAPWGTSPSCVASASGGSSTVGGTTLPGDPGIGGAVGGAVQGGTGTGGDQGSGCLISAPSFLGLGGGGCLFSVGESRALMGGLLMVAGAAVTLIGLVLLSGKGSNLLPAPAKLVATGLQQRGATQRTRATQEGLLQRQQERGQESRYREERHPARTVVDDEGVF
jgi:hypothetical protein